ncbi:MAG: hypothetical protein ACOCYE_12950 [Pseudomonadota bacterium]
MEHFDYKFRRGTQPAFDRVPPEHRCTLFGVDYVRLTGKQGGELFVTRYGWAAVRSVLPEAWFVDQRFKKVGRALAGATGAVYRVPVPHPARPDFALVAKFSRAGQDTSVTVLDGGKHLDEVEQAEIDRAEFLSPFEEFGNLEKLRKLARSAIPTKHPLAIYSPPTRYLEWQLGRKSDLCYRMNRVLLASQEGVPEERRIAYDWERIYVLLYRWIDGIDAEAAMQAGLIPGETMVALGQAARVAMRERGWMVCDHKPRHVILRPRRGHGGFLSRGDGFAWALIDYELLVPV